MEPNFLRHVIKAVLDETQTGQVDIGTLCEKLNASNGALSGALTRLGEEGLMTVTGDRLVLSRDNRLGLAVKAIELGADFQTVSRSLGWLEFEELAAYVFEMNGHSVYRRFRFQAEGRRWEMDVLALRRPYIVCAECKHWTRGMGNTTARGIVEAHAKKTEVFSRHLAALAKRIKAHRWGSATVVPVALTMSPTDMSIYRRVPSVSILALPSFLDEFGGQLERLIHYAVELPEWRPSPTQTRLR